MKNTIYIYSDDWYYPWNHGRTYDLSLDFFNNYSNHPRMFVLSTLCGNVDKHSPFDIFSQQYCWLSTLLSTTCIFVQNHHGAEEFQLLDDWYYPWNHGRTYDLSLDFFNNYIYIYVCVCNEYCDACYDTIVRAETTHIWYQSPGQDICNHHDISVQCISRVPQM